MNTPSNISMTIQEGPGGAGIGAKLSDDLLTTEEATALYVAVRQSLSPEMREYFDAVSLGRTADKVLRYNLAAEKYRARLAELGLLAEWDNVTTKIAQLSPKAETAKDRRRKAGLGYWKRTV